MRSRSANNNKIRLLACALNCLLCGASIAQTAPEQPVTPADLVLHYLQQDMFLRPGSGFQRVHIGQTFDQAAKVWGNPKNVQRQRVDAAKKWAYEAADGTVLILNGRQTIELITVAGTSSSLYQSVQGARFGMTPSEVARLYAGPPPRGKAKQLSYPRLGISFTFTDGSLAAMQVFLPKSP
jgi:hypothetical protein